MSSLSSKTVLLLHTLPDGSSHFDWLIDWPGADAGEGDLLTFRVAQFLPTVKEGIELSATRLPDHRRLYLSYEGALPQLRGQDRGTVQRVATGYSDVRGLQNALRIHTHWDSAQHAQLWEGTNHDLDSQLWKFVSLVLPPHADRC